MAGKQGTKNVRNMILSLGVTVLVAGFIWLFIPHDETQAPVKRVDYRVELLTARRAAPYPVAAPEGLSQDWKATSVRYRGDNFNAWHLGFHDPDGQYVTVEQSTEKPSTFVDRVSRGARETERTTEIDGRTWQRYTGEQFDALVLTEKDATTVVTGTASFDGLTKMARALATAS
ncbi:DUF4245 domain-containing protein [Streptomyces sp. NPDC058001]|uniref:DUF4245 domain-containing protein n=1 Tax=Streptomyces sp. NPDC058001 TaxID=3346300 RepID=UPI0036EA2DCF